MTIRRKAVWAAVLTLAVARLALPAAAAAQYRTPPQTRITFEEFKKLYDQDAVLVLDVRNADSYRAGHIPGAILRPLAQVLVNVDDLKREKRPIVAYCA
jgi:3-mercaptopyruvate sulfurtransferase SseA